MDIPTYIWNETKKLIMSKIRDAKQAQPMCTQTPTRIVSHAQKTVKKKDKR